MTAVGEQPTPAIELRGIVKSFPGVVANDGVDLKVFPGTIHAIVGENGAGKSTLMKTLYGAHRPDAGEILLNGEPVSFKSPRDAITRGIGMVFQHFMLADNLKVWENIVLGDEPGSFGHLEGGTARQRLAELAQSYGLRVDSDAYVSELGVGDKQRVEILKVLYRGARIVILDEPTAVLVPQEVDELFRSLRSLTAQGVTIIFISHKLDEVRAVADSITVLRAGRTVGEVRPGDVTARQLAQMMVGRELPRPEPRADRPSDDVDLVLDDVTVAGQGDRPALDHISLSVRKGEVVGVAGVEGNGQTELLDAIMGLRPVESGSIIVSNRDIASMKTRERREAGIGYIPEDRHKDGIVLSAPLWENVMLGHQSDKPFTSAGWINREAARQRTEQIILDYDVRTPSADVAAIALSGGNQQKLIVGREMTAGPTVLIAAHPTRGVDVGAQAAIWDYIRTARSAGLAVLLISADLEELVALADTLLVMLRGAVVARLDPATVTIAELGAYMTGAATGDDAA
jgi:general nucleoside transport system ATP-binding protein